MSGSDMLRLEEKYYEQGYNGICGIDEVGRGCYAGPVCTAAVILPKGLIIEGVKDSKKISEKKREQLFDVIREKVIDYSIGWASVEEVESLNVLNATMLAMKRAAEGLKVKPDFIMIDGNKTPELSVPCEAIIGGDAISETIAAASILAKVTRDRLMREYALRYPQYEFEKNKGYGTPRHGELVIKYGTCELHRMSYLRKLFARQEK